MPESSVNFGAGVSNAWSDVAAFVPKFAVFLLILIVGYRLVSRVHGQKSGDRPVVPCVRPGPFGE